MLAAQYTGKPELEIIDRKLRSLKPNEVMVRVRACGICGTDIKIVEGESHSTPPVITGHEFCGVVEDIGSEVSTLPRGDFVSVDPNITCGYCEYCRRGRVNLCRNLQALGVDLDGGFGEYCIAPAGQCYRLSEDVGIKAAAMVEPLSCALYGIRLAEIVPGDRVGIIGGGFIGLLMIQLSRLEGASEVIVSEPDENRRSRCLAAGADRAVTPRSLEQDASFREGVHVVIECVGSTETAEVSLTWVREGGTVVIFGVSPMGKSIDVSPYDIYKRDLTIRGSFLNPHTFAPAARLLDTGRIEFRPEDFGVYGLGDIPQAFDAHREREHIKTLIVMDE